MLFYLRSTKNHRMISQPCYKQKSRTFSVNINSLYKVNGMNNMFGSFTIKPLYLFRFDQALWFNLKNLANYFHKFFINETISSGIGIG